MRQKLVAVALAALAPVVAMLAYNEYALREQRSQEIHDSASQAARQAASEVERIIEGVHALLVSVTAMPSVLDLDVPECKRALRSVADRVDNIRAIFVVDLDGNAICSSLDPASGTRFADRAYFQQAVATKDFVVGTYTSSRISGAAVLPLAMPLLEAGSVRAVVVSGIRLDWLQSRLTERGVSPGNAVTIADGKGAILARVPLPERFVGTVIPDEYRALIHATRPGVTTVKSQDGTERILAYRPIALPSSPLYVSAGFSREEAFGSLNRATLMNALAICGGALAAFVMAILIGDRFILRPIGRISGVMDRWREGDATARTGMRTGDALANVGATLDRLLDELEDRRRRSEEAEEERRLLVGELAHRVKNGFSLVQAIASQTFGRADPARYKSFSQRLAALASTYDLILSRETSSSSVADVVSAALRAHIDPDEDRIHVEGPPVMLEADVALPLSLVIHELATNATKYGSLGSQHGRVEVQWKCDGRNVILDWTERGGPRVSAPTRRGFGSVLIERAFPSKARAETRLDYRPEGIAFQLIFLPEPSAPSGEV
ncbi:sensor histidine kinase [Pseudorhizobium pelagicum]|uniref:histidine kinase n=1 Tax=Pseudorhizobium pelagicum TaxID=1509405 RepID=A0A922NXI7_9HYPH|nr:sensor histidine kinase [Pseudorhizobium pelagicum]KEQ02946.1 histidine kinase [Pseudorhizobium pelagicum]KEQ04887.1 histidine kinase [Pseudorhizobium pelagicum]